MAGTIVKIKNSGVSGSPTSLATGELAYSYIAGTLVNGGDRLYIGTGTETGGAADNIDVVGGKYFTDKLDHTLGILTADSAVLVDSNKKINEWFVDNIAMDGNTISTTNPDGDLILSPNGNGEVVITGVISSTGNQDITGDVLIDGTLDVTGESTLASLTVSDLTDGRVPFIASGSQVVDSEHLLFDGSEFVVGYQSVGGIDRFKVSVTTGNIETVGTLNVDGQSTLASVNVEDLTTNRIVYTGASGELIDTANLTFDGSNVVLTGIFDVDNIRVDANRISATNVDGDIELQTGSAGIVDIISSQAIKVPVGTTAQRPVGSTGYIRFNTTDARFEGFDGNSWGTVGGVIDTDQDTYISAEDSPGSDNDDLKFYTNNVLRATYSTSGLTFNDENYFVNIGNIDIRNNTIATDSGTLILDPTPAGGSGTVVIEGDLQINGTTTTVNSTEITVDDPILTLGGDTAPTTDDNRDRGIQFRWHDGTSAKLGFFGWDDSTNRFTFFENGTNSGEIFSGTVGDAFVSNMLVDSSTFSAGNFTSNGVMWVDSSGDVQFEASAVEGHVLQINASGIPEFGIIDGGTY